MLQPANTSGLLRCACIRGLPPTVSAANVRRGSSVIGCASSGPEAIGLAERDLPDLALIDIHLIGPMDGIEVAQLLLERFGVPSIFLSGIGDDQTIERALTVSSLGFLQKPFLPSQVFDVIDRALTDILPLSR